MAFFDLSESVVVVIAGIWLDVEAGINARGGSVRCHRNVAAVEDGSPAIEGVGVERDVVAAAETDFA